MDVRAARRKVNGFPLDGPGGWQDDLLRYVREKRVVWRVVDEPTDPEDIV